MPSNPEPVPTKLATSPAVLSHRAILVLAGISVLSVGLYVFASHIYFRTGFPLDDAWIHQAYARNLALNGEWSLIPGRPSGGSTAPLWSILLALGYWLGLAPYAWTYLLGALALIGLSLLVEYVVREKITGYRSRFPWFGALVACEWHLVWAASSGMETILFTLLTTSVLVCLVLGKRNYIGIGLLIGLCVWIRPDGLTLLGPAILTAFLSEATLSQRLRAIGNLLFGFGTLFILYLTFNLLVGGKPLPSTFYAKQAEYALLKQVSFLERLLRLVMSLRDGVVIALLPGVLFWIIISFRQRDWGTISGIIWFVGFLLLYAWLLPVTYQHGRYLMPSMVIVYLWGVLGVAEFFAKDLLPRVGVIFWNISLVVILVAFWGRGAISYARDVAFIESEMVVTARWVASHLPSDALVAAHDIGALGYFGEHQLVDLAGLVTPDVIPFIHNESRLATYLDQRGVDFLMTFPDWYPELVKGQTQLFCSHGIIAPALGGENMVVYRWGSP